MTFAIYSCLLRNILPLLLLYCIFVTINIFIFLIKHGAEPFHDFNALNSKHTQLLSLLLMLFNKYKAKRTAVCSPRCFTQVPRWSFSMYSSRVVDHVSSSSSIRWFRFFMAPSCLLAHEPMSSPLIICSTVPCSYSSCSSWSHSKLWWNRLAGLCYVVICSNPWFRSITCRSLISCLSLGRNCPCAAAVFSSTLALFLVVFAHDTSV